jgi:hypothetical protein
MNEVENTMRRLAEETLLIKSRWCYFGFHNWTQYSDPKQRREGVYILDYQVRHCDSCRLINVKTLRSRMG